MLSCDLNGVLGSNSTLKTHNLFEQFYCFVWKNLKGVYEVFSINKVFLYEYINILQE